MTLYDGPPKCQRCGGALGHDSEICVCGGMSQYREARTARTPRHSTWEKLAEMDRRRDPPGDEDTGGERLTWIEAMAQLRRRYVP